jgi:hypothetical protein
VAETIDRPQLDLLALCLFVKPKERGDKHGDCHRRCEHQDQHGTVLLSLKRMHVDLVSLFDRTFRSRLLYALASERTPTGSFSELSASGRRRSFAFG